MMFTTNRWVRGEDFIGRDGILADLRGRLGRPTWILGNRRSGKTSLLRQIEWLSQGGKWPNTLTFYWDFQGAGSGEGLKEAFLECLEDKTRFIQSLGMKVEDFEEGSFAEVIIRFRRKLKKQTDQHIVFLIDEVEELVDIYESEPQILGALRKLQGAGQTTSLFITGSLRLLDLDESATRTSPFLPDFLPPMLLGPLTLEDTLTLTAKGGIDEETGRQIYDLTLGSPHLVQSMAEHYLQCEAIPGVLERLKRGRILKYFFQSNFNCLSQEVRGIWGQPDLLQQLESYAPNHPDVPYLKQSALIRADGDRHSCNPLLRFMLTGATAATADQAQPQPNAAPAAGSHPLVQMVALLAERPSALSVLPDQVSDDVTTIREATNPPALSVMYSAGESESALHRVLDWASPEYINGDEPDERTHVYLAARLLYFDLFAAPLHQHMTDPWDRAETIAEKSPNPATVDKERNPIDPKLSMILSRALRPNPDQRYQSLNDFMADLRDVDPRFG